MSFSTVVARSTQNSEHKTRDEENAKEKEEDLDEGRWKDTGVPWSGMLAPRLPHNAYRYKRGEMQGGGGPAEDVYLTWTGSALSCWWSQEGEIDR